MGKANAYMPLYIGDYLRDTMHLSTLEHGAYLLLIFAAWTRGGSIPDDDKFLSKTAGLSFQKWNLARGKISLFFTIRGGLWIHKRVTEESEKAQETSRKRSEAGKLGGRPPKAGLSVGKAGLTYSDSDSDSDSKETDQNQKQIKREAGRIAEKPPRPARREKPLPDDEWIASLKLNPAYSGLDIDRELGRARVWLETNKPQRHVTRRYLLGWLNRAEKPMEGGNGTHPKPSRFTGLASKDYTEGLDERGRIKLAGT